MALDKVPTRIEPAGSAQGAPEEAPRARVGSEAAGAAASAARPEGTPAAGASSAGAAAGAAASAASAGEGAAAGTARPAGAVGDAHPASEGAFASVSRWLAETFPNSRHAVLGGICGLIVAILLFTIGVVQTLVVVLFVTAGVAAGQFLDGDPKIARALQSLLRQR